MDSSELQVQLERYHSESYGWALSCCPRERMEAEDVLQTVYLKILEGKARYSGRGAFKTWLFAVIRKTAADMRRRKALHRLRLIRPNHGGGQLAPDEGPDEVLIRSQIQSLFEQALASLSRRQREVLQLVYYHDLSLQEAAKVMAVSVGSARTHYHRGKKRLRRWMEESEIFDEPRLGRKTNHRALP